LADEGGRDDTSRAALRARLRPKLPALCGPLRILAEETLGAEAPIDLLGVTPEGRLVVVLIAEAGRELELVGLALAQRAWVERRRRDLAQLVPAVRADLRTRIVLLAPDFSPTTRLALQSLAGEDFVCARIVHPAGASEGELWVELLRSAPERPQAEPRALAEAPRSRFRSRLSDADLGLGGDEPA